MGHAIGVLGATGRTGSATTRALMERGERVRVFCRSPESPKAQQLAAAGANVIAADMNDEPSLRIALDGLTRLFSVQPAFDSRGRYQHDVELAQGAAVASAAAAVGITHVVQVSAGTAALSGLPHFDSKLTIREGFEKAGIVVTALHPAPFMELMLDKSFAPALTTWALEPRIVGWDRPLPWVAAHDIGVYAADALTQSIPPQSHSITLVGDNRSLRSCRALVTEHLQKKPRRIPIPTRLARAMLGDDLIDMWHWMAEQDELPLTDQTRLLDVPGWLEIRSIKAQS